MDTETPTETTTDTGAGIFAHDVDQSVVKQQIENILNLDSILSSARRVERTAYINARADLEDRYNQVISELASIVNEDGELVDNEGEGSLADASRAEELREEARGLRVQMKAATSSVRFRALDSDAWDEFESAHRGKNREIKDPRTYENDLIAACAIAPTLSVEEITKLRKALGNTQIVALFNQAYYANTIGGLDVPKSPSFLHAPKPQE